MRRDEGYIKFSFAHEAAPPPVHPLLHDLMRIRDDLHEWELIGVLPDGIGYGNISTRIAGGGKFIHASSSAGKVITSSISTAYWTRNFVNGRRVF